MQNDVRLINFKSRDFWFWVAGGAIIWISIALIYHVFGIKWLEETDAGWYWSVVKNPAAFDVAIQPLYPLIVRGMIWLFPSVGEAVLGQLISFLCYILAIPFMYDIFKKLNNGRATEMTLLWALFPITGVTMCVYPRANALLLIMTVFCYWGYLKNNKYVFLFAVALLPLIHQSSLFFLVFLLPLAFMEKKIKWWMIFLAGLPTLIYIYFGSLKHGSLFWYVQFYGGIVPVTSLPLGDGLIGNLILGLRGSFPDLVQGSIVTGYFLLNIYMLSQKIWKKNLIVFATIFPVIILGLILPATEILAMITYTSYAVISFSLLDSNNEKAVEQKRPSWIYIFIIACLYFSQVLYALYDLHYYGVI